MTRFSLEKRLPRYHLIYEAVHENPFVPIYQITKRTGIARSTVSRYLNEMYERSILKGPMLFLNPAGNYHEYVAFVKFENSLTVYQDFKGFPYVISRNLCLGEWELMVTCEKRFNFSLLKGFKDCVYQGVKGVTHASKVTSLDWETSVETIKNSLSPPEEKTSLYEEISHNPWDEKEWALYHKFKDNVRVLVMPVLKECGAHFERFQKWFKTLQTLTRTYCGFYPYGYENYFKAHFLFHSRYQRQLRDILGLLPSTCYFFSLGDYLFSEVCFLNKKEQDDLFSLIYQLKEEGYFTHFYQSSLISKGG